MKKLLLAFAILGMVVQGRATQLSGTYTIDASGTATATTFKDIVSAITYLTSAGTRPDGGPSNSAPFGVSGPVVFDVATGSGPYTGQVVLPNVTGASLTNTVTINGNGNTIQWAPTASDKAVVRFNNGDFYRLKNFTIKTTNTTYGWGIHFYTNSDNNIVDSCTIDISIVTSSLNTNSCGIAFSGSLTSPTTSGINGYNNTISNNLIKGSTTSYGLYYGIVGGPSNTVANVSANKFINNTVQDFYSYAFYWQYGNSTVFDGNTIKRTASKTLFTTTYGFYFTNGSRNDTIRNNIVKDLFIGSPTTTTQCFGIYSINCTGLSTTQPNVVDNNLFNFNTGSGSQFAFYMLSAFNYAFRNNTVAFHNTTVTATYQTIGLYSNSATSVTSNFQMKNNVFYNNRTSTVGLFYSIMCAGTFLGNDLSKNAYYGTASTYKMASIGGADYLTFNDYKATTGGQDANSSDYNPNFVNASTGNFSPQDGWFNGNGEAMPHITNDVTGATRTLPIDIGAYEASPVALDVAVAGLNMPTIPYAAGNKSVEAVIRNAGTTTITTATINWKINNVPQTPVSFSGSLAGGAVSSPITLGNVNVQTGTIYTVEYTVSSPNGQTDPNTTNNTMSATTAAMLAGGTYTIDQGSAASATNFTSFNSLANLISMGGIGGALTINVVANSGPYTEQVFFNTIAGSSSTNTITVNGNGNTLQYNNTNSGLIGIMNVIKTNYVTFNQLNIKSLNASYGVGYMFVNNTNYINVNNCIIDISSVTGNSLSAGIAATAALNSPTMQAADNASNHQYIGNQIIGNGGGGAYYAISVMASNTSSGPNNGFVIKDNIIRDFTYYGIYMQSVYGSLISGNDISRPNRTSVSGFGGIYAMYPVGDTIVNNKITKPYEVQKLTATGIVYGLYLYFATDNTRPLIVKNNLIADIKSNGQVYGIYTYFTYPSYFYNNTVSIDFPTATTSLTTNAFYSSNSVTYPQVVKNNLLHVNRGGTGSKYLMYLATTSATNYTFLNNALFMDSAASSTNNYFGYYSGNKRNFAEWKAAIPTNPLDTNSVFASPKFKTGYVQAPFTPGQDSINNIGENLSLIVPTDITGATRSATPDPGCYEFDVASQDAGIIGFSSPIMPLTLGTHNVNAVVKNFGPTTVTSAKIDWSVNGVAQTQATFYGTLTSNDTISSLIGSYGFTNPGVYTLKAWSSNVNGDTLDKEYWNDTIQQTFCTPLSGTLTINTSLPKGSGNFHTFNEVLSLVNTCGVGGHVIVNVSAGTYNEKLVLNNIPSLTGGNRLSFVGADSATTKITFAGSSTADRATIQFNGADNVSFSNMRIENTGSSYAVALQILGSATDRSDSLSFTKCSFIVTSTLLSTYINPIEISSSLTSATSTTYINATALTIDSSSVIGGYYGMTLCAPNTTRSYGHKITNSLFYDFYYYGLYIYGAERFVFEYNDITAGPRVNATGGFGMYLNYLGENSKINANSITGMNGNYAIYCMYPAGTTTNKVQITNNNIQMGTLSNTVYAMYLYLPTHLVVANNAVNVTTASSTSTAFYLYSNNASLYHDVDMINNIFVNLGGGYVSWISDGGSGFPLTQTGLNWTIDNNVYYGLGQYPFRSNNTITTTFATWQTNNGSGYSFDSLGFVMNPNFPSATNLRTNDMALNNKGKANTWVPMDIDGNTRSATTPDIGVLEFTPPANDAGVISIAMPRAPQDTGLTDVKVVVKNYGASSLTSVDVTYQYGVTTYTRTHTNTIAPNTTDTVVFNATSGSGGTSQQLNYTGNSGVFTAYTANPNTTTDAVLTNDTLRVNICPGMSGVYTINPLGSGGRNFLTFAAAMDALNCGGVLGDVVFNVSPGTYSEQLEFFRIPGASDSTRITFRSSTLNKADVILSFNGQTATKNYVVNFKGTEYVNFEYMTVRTTNTTYGRIFVFDVLLGVNSANIKLRYNNIEGPVVTTSSDANALVFAAASSDAHDIDIIGNTLLNGSMAVYMGGKSIINQYSLRCHIDSNTITNPYYYGVYLTNRATQTLRNNIINPGASSYYGVFISGISTSSEIANNKITKQANYGVYIAGNNQYGEVGPTRFTNNQITVGGGTVSAVYLTNSSDMKLYNNSIYSATTSSSYTSAGIYFSGSVASGFVVDAKDMYFVNNAIHSGAAPSLAIANYTGLTGIDQLDYNVYNTNGLNLLYYNGTQYDTTQLNTARGTLASNNDQNSLYGNPTFTSPTNLTPNAAAQGSWILNGRGYQIYDLPIDIMGNARSIDVSTGAPDIGAYEFHPSTLAPVAKSIGAPSYGDTTFYTVYGDTVAAVEWGYSGTLPSSVTVRYAPGTLISNPALSPNNNAAQDTAAHLMDAYWTIAPVGGSGYSYNVRMFYKPTTMGTVPSASDIKSANRQVNGQHEWWNTNSFTTVLDTVIGMFGLDYQTEGTSYTATTTISSPLPVKLTNFTARKNRLDAVLNWTTAQERNSSHFVVERSFNRVQFTAVGRVAAAGNTTARSNYNFTDEQVGGIAKNQTVYYRLKIVDIDGRVEYSPIASVRFEEATRTAVNVFPNPFQSDVMVQINALSNTNATISVFDIMGKKVAEFVESVVEGDNAIALSKLNSLTNGVYFVKVNMDGNEVVTKLIKQ